MEEIIKKIQNQIIYEQGVILSENDAKKVLEILQANRLEKLDMSKIAEESSTFIETVFINKDKRWKCVIDNPSEDSDWEDLETLYIRAKHFIDGTKIEIHVPLEK